MLPFTFEFVMEIESFEAVFTSSPDEIYSHIEWYKEGIDDLMIVGSMHFSKSLLPTDERDYGTEFEVSISWFDTPQNVCKIIGEKRSVVELRADFMGIKRDKSNSAWFVFRELESTDYDSRKGIMDVYPDSLPSGKSMEFLDWSAEFESHTSDEQDQPEHMWPTGAPYECYYVTFEFELSPGALENPPRKRTE